MVNNKIIASFVHGYNDLELNIPDHYCPVKIMPFEAQVL